MADLSLTPSRAPLPGQRPRLVYMLYCGDLNGTEKMALATAQALAAHYGDIVLMAPPGRGAWTLERGAEGLAGIRVETLHGKLDMLRKLARLCLQARRVDFMAASVGHSLAGLFVAKLLLRPGTHLHVVHGGSHLGDGLKHKKLLNRLPLRFVAVSGYIARLLVAAGVRRDRITVIENFLLQSQKERAEAPPRAAPASAPFRYRVVVVARSVPIKRLDLVIAAVRLGLLDDVSIDVYGDGPLLDKHRAEASGLPNLVFHGYVKNVDERIAGADAFLHTCPSEASPLVVLEAFKALIPAVVPDAGGTADMVRDGVNGRLFRADDVHGMCAVLRQVLDMPATQRRAMVETAQRDLALSYGRSRGEAEYVQALELGTLAQDGAR